MTTTTLNRNSLEIDIQFKTETEIDLIWRLLGDWNDFTIHIKEFQTWLEKEERFQRFTEFWDSKTETLIQQDIKYHTFSEYWEMGEKETDLKDFIIYKNKL